MDRLIHPRGGERGKSYTFAAGVLDDIWGFDPAAFGLSPREAEQMDPQQRLLLELAWEALEDAGVKPSAIAGSDAGVFVGASALDYGNLRLMDAASGDAYLMTGNTLSIVSNRISYIFDLHGPSFTIDTACSSALVALNEAVVSLRSGRIDTAIVGGVNIMASPFNFIGFSQAAMLSRVGLCQAFAAGADGYVRAEGGVVLVLRTREAAERAGNHIHGFIVGSDVNSDGRTNGISLPSKIYQARLLQSLYLKQAVDPRTLAFVEAHGTGTRVGDPIEAMALGEILAQKRDDPLLIGSIKTNIGHMEAASGLGGVLKAMLALEHDQLPPSLHSEELNPDIDFAALNLKVARELTPLAPTAGERRVAGVNSFGFGGSNAHVILADGPRTAASSSTRPSPPSCLIISAHSRAALAALVADYAARLDEADEGEAAEIVAAAAYLRERLPHRVVVPAGERAQLVALLDRLSDADQEVTGAARATAVEREAPVAAVFSGNGAQFVGMGVAAYAHNASFRAHLDLVSEDFAAMAGWSIVETLHDPNLSAKLELTQIAQPLLYAVQIAAYHALVAGGLKPAVVIGHSVGEVAAAEAAGILDRAGALQTIFARSLHQELSYGLGGMAVVIGSQEATDGIIAALPSLEIAAYNSPRAFTVSGRRDHIEKLSTVARGFKARVRKLDLAYPFHSALMAPVEHPLLRSLAALKPATASLPFISTVTGASLDGPELDARYWWRNVREPVRFAQAVDSAVKAGARIFVEVGPTASLLSHINDCVDERTATIATLCALDRKDRGNDPIAATLALALARGAAVDDATAFGAAPAPGSRVALPLYPWQRKPYRLADTTESLGLNKSGPWHPLIGARPVADRLEWHSTIDTMLHPSLADHCVDGRAILPGAAFAEMALAVARDWLGSEEATVADLEITSPMILTADASREVVCRLSPQINQLEIVSRSRLGQTPWQTHATAKIVRDTAAAIMLDEDLPTPAALRVDGAEIYAMAAQAGLQYGPAFRKLASAALARTNCIVLDLVGEEAAPAYGIDPARMDACFHALVLIFAGANDAIESSAFIPVRFREIRLRRPGATFTKARIDVLRCDERVITANFLLMDEAGDVVVFMREARFQAIRTKRGAQHGNQVIVQTSALACEPTAARNDRPLALATLRRGLPAPSCPRDTMAPDFVLLEGWATAVALGVARKLARGQPITVDALVASGRLPARAKPWLEALLVSLDRSGLSGESEDGRHIDPDVVLPEPAAILRTLGAEHQNLGAEMLVAASVDAAVRALVAGDHETFLKPLSTKSIDGWELGGSQAHAAAAALVDLLRHSRNAWPRERAMRVLQVGYGPLTSLGFALAAATQARFTVFEPNRRRMERARVALTGRGDIVFVERAADLPVADFDFVIAAHALYRHPRETALWSSLRRSMAQGAIFAAVEPAPSFFRDLVLGLDACLAGEADVAGFNGHSVTEADWLESMRSVGFIEADVTTIKTATGHDLLLTAQVEAERRHWSGTGDALIIGAGDARDTEITSAFATLLASSGLHVSITLDSELSEEVLAKAPETIVYFIAASDGPMTSVKSLLDQCMRLKRLADGVGARKTVLWLVTTGAMGAADGSRAADVAAGLWAFSRTLANEMPTLDVRRIDLAAVLRPDLLAERLRDLVLSKTTETEILLAPGDTRVVRFEAVAALDRGRPLQVEAARLVRGEGSGIDRIHWEPISRRAPGAAEVEIAVDAIGLNFRDVMFGLGLLPEDILEHGFAGPTLGLECAGRIERVGSAVKGLKPGDRVIAFARNAFATHVTTPAAVVAAIPGGIAADMAATIPVAFLTAYYGLMLCARLKPAEWVLIHGGAGGVGLAAIQVARWRGARIIATAGSPEKRALLAALGAEHVFDSRSGAFVEDVRRVTGKGVAVVLNSLSGEAMERSIGVLAPFGRFVELGKRDYVANTHVGLRPFRRNLSYFGVDLDQLLIDEPRTSRSLMRSVLSLFARGALTPLPFRAFAADETVEAFRLMQQSSHIGKLVVRPPALDSVVSRQRRDLQISANKIHLVTGGFGGFGLETARWLAGKGAKHLLLVGRSGAASPAAQQLLAELASGGVDVRAESMDIADRGAVQRLFARFGKDLPALAGVVHAAMVLDDALLPNVTAERFEQVLRPKVAGGDHLDQATRLLPLDYFVLFSSATTLIGNPGQAAYVAANGYLEGLARRRRAAGLPALAICWGAIEDVGVLARSDGTREALATRLGMKGMLARDALRQMEEALGATASSDDAVVTIAPLSWSSASQHLAVLRGPSYARLMNSGEATTARQSKIDIVELIAGNSPDEARKVVSGLIVDEIARVLRLPREDIAKTTPLAEIGLDSLMAVELALGLEERFALKAPLSATASGFSVNELADYVIGSAMGTLSGEVAAARSMVERHLGPSGDIDTIEAAADLLRSGQHAGSALP